MMTFAKTALSQLTSKPVTVAYPAESLAAPAGLRGHVVNDTDTCVYCGMCARRCPAAALAVDRKAASWTIDPLACVACGECVESCPKGCLSMAPERAVVTRNLQLGT